MMGIVGSSRMGGVALALAPLCWASIQPALAFCVRNDTGATIHVEALDGTASFSAQIANNKKVCCSPKNEACAVNKGDVKLSIRARNGEATCDVMADPKSNINVTGKQNALKCKANQPGATMDWAPG